MILPINIVLACKYIGQSKKKCFKFSRALRRMNGDVLYVFEWGEWTVMYNVFEWGEWTVMYYMCLAVRRVNGDVYMCLSEESERWCIMCLSEESERWCIYVFEWGEWTVMYNVFAVSSMFQPFSNLFRYWNCSDVWCFF